MIVKRFGCTTIHKKRYINASFIHSFILIPAAPGFQGVPMLQGMPGFQGLQMVQRLPMLQGIPMVQGMSMI